MLPTPTAYEALHTKCKSLETALRRLAFRENNDWPRSKTCLVCGRCFSADGREYHDHDCPLSQ